MSSNAAEPPAPQAVATGLTNAAIFLIVTINPGADDAVRDVCAGVSGLVRAVGFRDPASTLTCVTGFGADAWRRLARGPMPAELHPFQELHAGNRHAIATPGDVLFHIRAKRMDLCFELASQLMNQLGDGVTAVQEVHGFRYFDNRDLMGFVDGTENPVGAQALAATAIGDEDPAFAGGSYVITQKYLHDLAAWDELSTEEQEGIIGRKKLSDIELADDVKPSNAHNALTSITIDGEEVDIVRDNMPFGSVSQGEFGTYFIGYAKSAAITEQMLRNMFLGDPPGNYDRILDFSTAVTGNLFFVPSQPMLDGLADEPAAAPEPAIVDSLREDATGSLNIGSLRGTAAS
ncbi:MAG TPA: Dyp-type peroxidase [Pseudonocardiaceae bacterium]|nr:Dyp-type peroxidase [Pseudonocardiaceae bacterium]